MSERSERMTSVVVTVHGDHLDRIGEVVAGLRAAGLHVERVLEPVGVVTGSVDPGRRAVLAAVPGVTAVEDDRTVRLPPPDSPVQ
jgi:hypothetical protein